MLYDFINFWRSNYPDIITGWNTEFFDIPYLVNRMNKLFDESFTIIFKNGTNFVQWVYLKTST